MLLKHGKYGGRVEKKYVFQKRICELAKYLYAAFGRQMEVNMNQQEMDGDKILKKVGWALFWMVFSTLGSQIIISYVTRHIFAEFYYSEWFVGILSIFTTAGIGYPVFFAAMRRIPDTEYGEPAKLTLRQFLAAYFICTAFMYISNIVGTYISELIKGKEAANPLEDFLASSNIIIILIYVALFAPVFEELVFRKVLLNKLRRFGDVPAILLSAFAFGLIHMNISQFFYASTIGILFGYIAIRTNSVRYTILLHMIINLIGSVVAPMVVLADNQGVWVNIFGLWVITSMVAGLILFVKSRKGILLEKGEVQVERRSEYILHTGTVLFLLICGAMLAISFI